MDWASIVPLVLLALAFIFLVVRPARRRQREFQGLQAQLEPGVRIMIASGIFGQIESLDDETFQMRVADNVVITVNRHAVARIVMPGTDSETSTDS